VFVRSLIAARDSLSGYSLWCRSMRLSGHICSVTRVRDAGAGFDVALGAEAL
jgi:hypothetical protein